MKPFLRPGGAACAVAAMMLFWLATTALALDTQGSDTQDTISLATQEPRTGPVTNLPLPRYVSMKAAKGNARRGPSLTHRIDWVFQRRDMPLRITAEHGHWRRVEDRDGEGGWIHYSLLSGTRTVLVEEEMLMIRGRPEETAPARAALEAGVIARLGTCGPEWCELRSGGHRGWAQKAYLWGIAPDELRD